jgi:hypothetical protein
LRYTIEARELTNENTQRRSFDGKPRRTMIEAVDVEEAISQFLVESASELVSLRRPVRGRESIATIKKDDCVYLVRVYAA